MTIKDNPIDTRIDEERVQEEFIIALGGIKRADRLQYLYNNSYSHYRYLTHRTKEDDFRIKAKHEGYTDKQVDLFLKLWEL